MGAPIYVSPDSAKFAVTTQESTKLLAALQSNTELSNKKLGVLVGSFSAENIDFSYTYDGSQFLIVTITGKHGLHKFAPNDTIFDNVNDLIAKSVA